MSRKCSCCEMVGHNVTKCMDPCASKELYELFNDESVESAMSRVERYSPGLVSFILVKGFGVPAGGKVDALRELVRTSYIPPDETIAEMEKEEMISYSANKCQMLQICIEGFNYRAEGILELMPSHPQYDAFLGENAIYLNVYQIMIFIVKTTLESVYASILIGNLSQLSINRKMKNLLEEEAYVDKLSLYAEQCDLIVSVDAINHLVKLSQMINYKRVAQCMPMFDFTELMDCS